MGGGCGARSARLAVRAANLLQRVIGFQRAQAVVSRPDVGGEMQKLGPEVFVAFEHEADARFHERLARLLREALPELAAAPEPAFSAQVRLVVEQARSYGLRSERTIGAFAVTAGLLGPDFVDQHPAVHDILVSHDDEFRKAELLEEFTVTLLRILEQ